MKREIRTNTHTIFLLTCVLLLWSSTYICIKIGLGLDSNSSDGHHFFSAGPLALFRAIVASMTLLLLNLRNKTTVSQSITMLTRNDHLLIVLFGIFGFATYYLALNLTQLTIPANVIGFIASQTPVLTAVLAIFILKEKIALRSWLGISIGTIGLTLIFFSSPIHFTAINHVIWVFIALSCSGCYLILQKILLAKLPPLTLISIAMWIGTLCLLPFLPQLIHEISSAPWQIIAVIIYLGVFPSAVADVLWGMVLTRIPLAKAMIFYYAFPFATMLLALWLLNENPSTLLVTGGIVAFLGATLFNFYNKNELEMGLDKIK